MLISSPNLTNPLNGDFKTSLCRQGSFSGILNLLSPLNDGSLLRASLSASTGSLLCQIVFIGNKKTTLGVFNAAAKVHPRGAISIRMIGEARPSHTDSQKKTERCW